MRQPGRVILASQSAARAAVLTAAGVVFEARPARIDEAAIKAAGRAEGAGPDDVALTLAGLKARRIREPGAVVVGADQLLVCEGRWFDKPADLAEARDHLLALRGRSHALVTAILCYRDGVEIWRHLARPSLTMRAFSDAFLDQYLALEGDELLGSVGAYRLEGIGAQLFDRVEGEHAAVLGLPLLPLLGFLRQCGVLTS
ncbi:MAG: Maf family protein [Janthinobacterium lividum]